MDPVITQRHCDIAPDLRDRAAVLLQRLGRLAGRTTEAAAVFSLENSLAGVELRLGRPGEPVLVAQADGPDHRSALDLAGKRLRGRIARASGRTRGTRHAPELPPV